MSRVFIEVDKGNFGHTSLSLNVLDNDLNSGSGTRLIGPKCWGGGKAIHSFELSLEDVQNVIEELLSVQAILEEENE